MGLDAISQRQSPLSLREPAPGESALQAMLTAAMCAPDHGRLRPWRFIMISGDDRRSFGQVLADALQSRQPSATPAALERECAKALRAPLIVVAVAKVAQHQGVPAIEQIIAAGVAASNMLVAAHELGFGGMWRTGAAAYDPGVKSALGLAEEDAIVGFLYLGTPDKRPPPRTLPPFDAFVSHWGRQ
ncbi:MAG: nitroreductase [Betaproteobacteria bacterium]|nr:MAG: nitroreductase [Betaproteobacteria bacterium]